jgi:hypothetical protein
METAVGLIGACHIFNNPFVLFGCGDSSNKSNKANFFTFA